MASGEAVANEPRLFVGQIPVDCTEESLWPLFRPFGTVRNLHILRGPDSKPRGCAMVLFARWGQAESAAEALDGAAALSHGQGRPLVVHFANPRKPPPGQPAEPGLAPRKLFVGQIPRDVTEDILRPYFEPWGEIEHINILRTQRGQSAGCGFVQFRKWSQAENAMEAHNGKTRLSGSEVPLVVKFADAKRREQQMQSVGLGMKRGSVFGDSKHLPEAADYAAYQLGQQWQGTLLQQANPMLGNGLLNNQLALQNLMANTYNGGYATAQYSLTDPGLMHQVHRQPNIGISGESSLERLQDSHLHNGGNLGNASLGNQSNLGITGSDPLAGQLLTNAGNMSPSLGLSQPLPQGHPLKKAGTSGSLGSLPVSTADLAQQLSELNIANLGSQNAPSEGSSGTPFAQPQQAIGLSTGIPELTGKLNPTQRPQPAGLPSLTGGTQFRPDMQSLYLQGMGGISSTGVGAPYGHQLGGLAVPGGMPAEQPGRSWGQKTSSNEKFNDWKLFVGQVPLEASEQDLHSLFKPIGPILELYILRNNNHKSRGCAFVSFESKALAEQAITKLNGRPMPSGKTLVVKFADRAAASSKPTAPQTPLMNLYLHPS